jgi:hypothetical protein
VGLGSITAPNRSLEARMVKKFECDTFCAHVTRCHVGLIDIASLSTKLLTPVADKIYEWTVYDPHDGGASVSPTSRKLATDFWALTANAPQNGSAFCPTKWFEPLKRESSHHD